MIAMERGISLAIQYAQRHLGITQFPDIYALIVVTDADAVLEPTTSRCQMDDDEQSHPWPPIFGQNVRFHEDNVFVMLPDFSFFSTFADGMDHGTPDDEWFRVVEQEMKQTMVAAGAESAAGQGMRSKKAKGSVDSAFGGGCAMCDGVVLPWLFFICFAYNPTFSLVLVRGWWLFRCVVSLCRYVVSF
jgi:hypothetical protein